MSAAVHCVATSRRTPYSDLDVVAGAVALSSMAERVVLDGAEGALLDVTLPQAAALAGAAAEAGVWVWTDRAPGAGEPSGSPAPVVVLDRRDAGAPDPDVLGAGAVVLRSIQVPSGPVRVPLLLDLPTYNVVPPPAIALRDQPAVAGFALFVHGANRAATAEAVLGAVRAALQDWRRADRTARPVLVVRGASLTWCRMLLPALRRMSGALSVPVPRVRVDVTAAVLAIATTTWVRVLGVSARPGRVPVLDLDGLPPLDRPLQVAGQAAGQVTDVMLRHSGRVASGAVLGPVPAPGVVLVARGWPYRLSSAVRGRAHPGRLPSGAGVPGPRPASG